MSPDLESEEVLSQLRGIRAALSVIAGSLVTLVVLWGFSIVFSSLQRGTLSMSTFEEEAGSLLDQSRYMELLVLCDEQLRENPQNPYASWYAGVAHYELGQHAEAIEQFELTLDWAPGWESLVLPYLERATRLKGEASQPHP